MFENFDVGKLFAVSASIALMVVGIIETIKKIIVKDIVSWVKVVLSIVLCSGFVLTQGWTQYSVFYICTSITFTILEYETYKLAFKNKSKV